jgi:Glycerol-3-phosphate acyltransferase C-terminal region
VRSWLRHEILIRDGHVAPLGPDTVDLVVDLVLENIVGNNQLVKRHKDRFMVSLYSPKERLELSLYRNGLIHLFVAEGLLACCLYANEGRTSEQEQSVAVSRSSLLEQVSSTACTGTHPRPQAQTPFFSLLFLFLTFLSRTLSNSGTLLCFYHILTLG